MLRLLAQRGEAGYEDIAALKGIGVEEAREQARAAVAQLEEEGLPPPAIPLEPSAGEASAPSPAPERGEGAPRADDAPRSEPSPSAAPKEKPPEPERPSEPREPAWQRLAARLPEGNAARGVLAAAGAAAIILLAVLLFGGGNDGGGGSETTSAGGAGDGGARNAQAGGGRTTSAVLRPVGDSEARGRALFGRLKNDLALQVVANGLEPTERGQVYAIWASQSPQRMLPLAFTPVGANGRMAVQFKVPLEVLAFLAQEVFTDIAITRVERRRLERELDRATKAKRAPRYTGEEVLRGRITGPIVGAAKRDAGGR